MSESSTEVMILDQRSYPAVFDDLDGTPSGEQSPVRAVSERVLTARKIDRVALSNIRRPSLATTSIRVGALSASVEFWFVDLDVTHEVLDCFRQWLSHEELARAARFHSDLHRARYMVGRGTLRCLLADRLGCSPAAIRLSYGKNGKPMLEGARSDIEFNLGHSGGDAVMALADNAAIGVDIELLRPIPDVESLAGLVFSDVERRELELAPDPVLAFLNGWTRKEAYVKALGLGLKAPLKDITVSLSNSAELFSTGLREQSVSNWRLVNVPHPRAVVAVAFGPRLDSGTTTRGKTTKGTQESSPSRRVNS